MPGNGWIKLHRKIKDNILWQDKPFSKGQAWIDILMEVNHKENEILLGNKIIKVETGEKITSIRKLCDRWGWSNTKIINFLELLTDENMIIYKSDTKKTSIKVLNYGKYQHSVNEESDSKTSLKHIKNDSKASLKHTNKNVKNVKNEKEINIMSPSSKIDKIYSSLNAHLKELIDSYIDIYKLKNKTNKITDNKHYKLLDEINQIYQKKKFSFDGQEYQLTENTFEDGINILIEKGIDNINYAKKVWISNIEKEKDTKPDFAKPTIVEGTPEEERFLEWYNEQI